MNKNWLQRSEGNPWYDGLTCVPLLIFDYIISAAVGFWFPEAVGVLFGLLLIPMGIVYLWFIGWLMKGRWYLEYDEQGLTYHVLFMNYYYSWTDVSKVYSKKSPAFIGKYHDTLVVEAKGKPMDFFLHDFGLKSKKPTVAFIENIIETWSQANPQAAQILSEHQQKPSESDEEDLFDEEY